MTGRSKLLTWGLPIVGVVSLTFGTGMVIENRPVTPVETPPRQPASAPTSLANVDSTQFIGAIGVSEPAGEAMALAAHMPGVVTAVHVEVGDRVVAGQPLFAIDAREARAAVRVRRAQVDVARANVESLRATIPPARAALDSATAALDAANASILSAQADLNDRSNQLRIAQSVTDPRAIAAEEIDRRRFAQEQAAARVASAQAEASRAQALIVEAEAELSRLIASDGADGPELRAATAQVRQAEQELAAAETEVALHTVTSPTDARILQRNIRLGEYAPAAVPTQGLLVLGQLGPDHVRVELDEVDIPRFHNRARAWASPRGAADIRVPLEFVLVEPLVVPKTTLSGRTSELVDTRVLQVVYALDASFAPEGLGQQFDVFIEAQPTARTAGEEGN